jgi:hypothetical protein
MPDDLQDLALPAEAPALDTSGRVAGNFEGLAVWYEFEDLTPLAQGYITAMLRDWVSRVDANRSQRSVYLRPSVVSFTDLAPETLATILKDCEAALPFYRGRDEFTGALFWRDRQEGRVIPRRFGPLHLNTNPTGRIVFGDDSHGS